MNEEIDAIKSRIEHIRGGLVFFANDPDLSPEASLLIERTGASLIAFEQDIEQLEKVL